MAVVYLDINPKYSGVSRQLSRSSKIVLKSRNESEQTLKLGNGTIRPILPAQTAEGGENKHGTSRCCPVA